MLRKLRFYYLSSSSSESSLIITGERSAISTGPMTKSEPLLKSYVCESGSATTYCETA